MYPCRVITLLTHTAGFCALCFGKKPINGAKNTALLGFLFLAAAFFLKELFEKKDKRSNGKETEHDAPYKRPVSGACFDCAVYLTDLSFIVISRLNVSYAKRQLVWAFMGLALYFLSPVFKKLILLSKNLYTLMWLLGAALLACPFFLGAARGGATNWVDFRVFGQSMTFQPSEIVKILFVFFLAGAYKGVADKKTFFGAAAACAAYALILVYQKDLGTAVIFFAVFFTLSFIAGSGFLFALSGGFCAAGAAWAAYALFAHVRTRFVAWLDPFSDITGAGYQTAQATFAMGTYGLFGAGLNMGSPLYIPAVINDFIFAAVTEELGVIFALCLILIFAFFLTRVFFEAGKVKDRYAALVAAGLAASLFCQTFLIIGGVTRLIPLTGVTLPFVSYGGTSIVISFIMLSVISALTD